MNDVIRERLLNAERAAGMREGASVDDAYSLICRTVRYALADAREWEIDNDAATFDGGCRQHAHEHRQDLLDRRRERLDAEWGEYGLHLHNYGLYPSVVDADGVERVALTYYE